MEYKYLNEFINKYKDYELLDKLVYNSYAVKWSRDTHRDYDSVSVSEILNLIEDCNLQMVTRFHWDKMKEAQRYGTQIHSDLEQNILWFKQLDKDQPIHKQYRLACIKENIVPKIPEEEFKLDIGIWIPLTWTIDLQALINDCKWLIDFKTSKGKRNFISVKSKLQICFYLKLSWLTKWWLLYLNQKWYTLMMLSEKDIKYYTLIVEDLIKYTQQLFRESRIINLASK